MAYTMQTHQAVETSDGHTLHLVRPKTGGNWVVYGGRNKQECISHPRLGDLVRLLGATKIDMEQPANLPANAMMTCHL